MFVDCCKGRRLKEASKAPTPLPGPWTQESSVLPQTRGKDAQYRITDSCNGEVSAEQGNHERDHRLNIPSEKYTESEFKRFFIIAHVVKR